MPKTIHFPRPESPEARRERLLRDFTLLLLLGRADAIEQFIGQQWSQVRGGLTKELADQA